MKIIWTLITVLIIWGLSAVAISVGLYYTHDIRCLWFLLIPAFTNISFKSTSNEQMTENEDNNG